MASLGHPRDEADLEYASGMGDVELEDRKMFQWISRLHNEFIIRVSHRGRLAKTYNARLDRWERETLGELAETVSLSGRWKVAFRHAREKRWAEVRLGWFRIRLPETPPPILWVFVAHDTDLD